MYIYSFYAYLVDFFYMEPITHAINIKWLHLYSFFSPKCPDGDQWNCSSKTN